MPNQKLHNLVLFFQNVVENARKDVLKEVESGIIQGVIEDMNTQQLAKGIGSDGAELPHYSDVSVEKYGKRPGAMTMKDTGDFYDSIKMKLKGNNITLISNDYKMKAPIKLEWRYGALLGLTKKNQKKLATIYLTKEVADSIKKQIKKI